MSISERRIDRLVNPDKSEVCRISGAPSRSRIRFHDRACRRGIAA